MPHKSAMEQPFILLASQLEDVLGKKIQIEKAAYEDKNKNAESGRENMD